MHMYTVLTQSLHIFQKDLRPHHTVRRSLPEIFHSGCSKLPPLLDSFAHCLYRPHTGKFRQKYLWDIQELKLKKTSF